MICFPNAKINIGLHIVSRRSDGYHNLETLFYPIGLKDALEVIPIREKSETLSAEDEPGYRLFQSGTPVTSKAKDNLVVKALQLAAGKRAIPPIDIHLLKKIPSGAGLGGGSSDAAFMLQLLNDTFGLDFAQEELTRMAASLGADCAFFTRNQPALASGIGDVLEPVDLDLSGYFFMLVKPEITISTKEAYAMITPGEPEQPLKEIIQRPIQEWKGAVKNDFEPVIFEKYPEIYRIKQQLYEMGALYASMSGSGSAVYAFFKEEPATREAFHDHFVWTNKPL